VRGPGGTTTGPSPVSYQQRARRRVPCSSVLGTNQADVVPAKAGTHNHQGFSYYPPPAPHRFAAAYGSPPSRGRQRRAIASQVGPRSQCSDLLGTGSPLPTAGTNGECCFVHRCIFDCPPSIAKSRCNRAFAPSQKPASACRSTRVSWQICRELHERVSPEIFLTVPRSPRSAATRLLPGRHYLHWRPP